MIRPASVTLVASGEEASVRGLRVRGSARSHGTGVDEPRLYARSGPYIDPKESDVNGNGIADGKEKER